MLQVDDLFSTSSYADYLEVNCVIYGYSGGAKAECVRCSWCSAFLGCECRTDIWQYNSESGVQDMRNRAAHSTAQCRLPRACQQTTRQQQRDLYFAKPDSVGHREAVQIARTQLQQCAGDLCSGNSQPYAVTKPQCGLVSAFPKPPRILH